MTTSFTNGRNTPATAQVFVVASIARRSSPTSCRSAKAQRLSCYRNRVPSEQRPIFEQEGEDCRSFMDITTYEAYHRV